MTDRLIKLDGYMPVRIDGLIGLCQHLSLDRLLVDLPEGSKLKGEQAVTLLCSESLSVSGRVRVVGVDGVRHEMEVIDYLGNGRERLSRHASAHVVLQSGEERNNN